MQTLRHRCLRAKSKHRAQRTELTAPLGSYSEHKALLCRPAYANILQIRKRLAVSDIKKLLYAGFYGDTVPLCIPKTGFPNALPRKKKNTEKSPCRLQSERLQEGIQTKLWIEVKINVTLATLALSLR